MRVLRPVGLRASAAAALLLLSALGSGPAWAGLFDDDEARRAILEIRQRLDEAKARSSEQSDQLQQLRRSVLELSSQNDQLRNELAALRGQQEQATRDLAELQRKQKDIVAGVDERVRKLEPQTVTVDGKEFQVDPDERRQYEDAVALMRKSDYAGASTALLAFTQRYPNSGYKESALFWLGNARYAGREYKEAIWAFRALVTQSPQHAKAPEALLSLANCQIELKDRKAANKTLDELIKAYPDSEAAKAAQERVSSLR